MLSVCLSITGLSPRELSIFPVDKPLPPSLLQKFKLIVNIYKLFLCVCCVHHAHLHAFAWVCAWHLHVCACPRSTEGLFICYSQFPILRQALPVSPRNLLVSAVLRLQICTIMPCWQSKPRSSGLPGKPFTEQAISLALRSVYSDDPHLKLWCLCRCSAVWQSGSEQPKLLLKELCENSVFNNSCSSRCGHLFRLCHVVKCGIVLVEISTDDDVMPPLSTSSQVLAFLLGSIQQLPSNSLACYKRTIWALPPSLRLTTGFDESNSLSGWDLPGQLGRDRASPAGAGRQHQLQLKR